MASVGLLYVGAVLFVNGAMLLGWVALYVALRPRPTTPSRTELPERSPVPTPTG